MPKICYFSKNFQSKTLDVIGWANEIIEEYQAEGYDLTLRQLYYQFVSRGLIPNEKQEYERLGSIISDARLAGLIDWEALVDRTRYVNQNPHWNDPGEIIGDCARQYQLDKWVGQNTRVEVWVEKDALAGVLERACRPLDVVWFCCRGYTSQSEMWRAAERLKRWNDQGVRGVILHLGDHDPSGVDMTRDIIDRLTLFGVRDFHVYRIALNMDQIETLNPPPNPAKLTDSRSAGYIRRFGRNSWELDALDPRYLNDLIEGTVSLLWNKEKFRKRRKLENLHKQVLRKLSEEWEKMSTEKRGK